VALTVAATRTHSTGNATRPNLILVSSRFRLGVAAMLQP
jgi:hypothetical protein